MSNNDVRAAARESGVYLWQIADALGIADATFSRKLRKELGEAEKAKIFEIIKQLKKEEKQ